MKKSMINRLNADFTPTLSSFCFKKKDFIIAISLFIFYFIVRFITIGIPNEIAFDEIYYIPAANDYLHFQEDSNWVHPPLAKMIIASFSALFGFTGEFVRWRIASCFFGALSAGLSYLFGTLVFNNRELGFFTSFFIFFDFLLFVLSGIALLDIFLVFFMMLSSFFLRIAISEKCERYTLFFSLSSLSAGFAGACKWSGIFSLFFLILSLFVFCKEISVFNKVRISFLCCSLFIFSYFLPYIYYFLIGGTFDGIISTFEKILSFQIGATWTHNYIAPMWKWVFMIRPVWVWFYESRDIYAGIIAMGNPLFWWSFPFFFIFLLIYGIRKKDSSCIFIVLGYILSFVLWIFSKRQGFFYYMAPSVIWMALGTVKTFSIVQDKNYNLVIFFCVAIFIIFLAYFPCLNGMLVSKSYFRFLFFISSWV